MTPDNQSSAALDAAALDVFEQRAFDWAENRCSADSDMGRLAAVIVRRGNEIYRLRALASRQQGEAVADLVMLVRRMIKRLRENGSEGLSISDVANGALANAAEGYLDRNGLNGDALRPALPPPALSEGMTEAVREALARADESKDWHEYYQSHPDAKAMIALAAEVRRLSSPAPTQKAGEV